MSTQASPATVPSTLALPVSLITQRDTEVYSFVISADQLLQVARIDRFGESSDGVNRKLDERHALRIAEAMVQTDTVMLDAICGDLKGDWRVENGRLIPGEGAYLSIDDGQHRYVACTLLNLEERERWSFNVTATKGLDYTTRLRVFRQQRLRKHIDSRLDLAQRHRLDEWANDAQRQAYKLVLELNSDPNSPLKGMIVLEETVKRPYEHQHRAEGINANGLWGSLTSVMGKGSPLYGLSLEKRAEVALNLIRVASEVWSTAWCSKGHVLTTARGINAVVKLIVSGPNFRVVIGDDFRVENLRRALELAKRFNWTVKAHKNASQKEMVAALDDTIGRSHQRAIEQGSGEIKA
jgi:DGQHR domain-containing protein